MMSGREGRTIRLMLVDDHPVMRAWLANLLSGEPGFSVVAQASDARTALAGWREHRPDVLLLDISLPGIDGIEVLRQLKAEAPQARVLMLTSSEAKEDRRQSMAAGAAGYVTKSVDPEALFAAIRGAFEGLSVIDQGGLGRPNGDESGETLSLRVSRRSSTSCDKASRTGRSASCWASRGGPRARTSRPSCESWVPPSAPRR